jgi:MoaA/NifB/PqqE/SkfB family radical SAM enzyme
MRAAVAAMAALRYHFRTLKRLLSAAAPAERNRLLAEKEFRQGQTRLKSLPSWIGIETSAACNLRCVHCPRQDPSVPFIEHGLDPVVVERVLPHLPLVSHLQLHGLGEPLLASSFWTITEDERTARIAHLDVNSNGTLLSDANIDRLLKSHVNVISISLDAATASTYRKIRGGAFDKVTGAVHRLVQARKNAGRKDLRISVNMTLMRENIEELPAFIDLAADLGVNQVDVWQMNLRGDTAQRPWRIDRDGWTFDYSEQHLSNAPALSDAMLRQAKAVAKRRGVRLDSSPQTVAAKKSGRPISQCRHPWTWMLIDPRGAVKTCCHTNAEIGQLAQQDLDALWNNPLYRRLRGAIRDGYVDPICRNAACAFVRETERLFGRQAYDFRLEIGVGYLEDVTRFCQSGWHVEEWWGVWSVENVATLTLDIAGNTAQPLRLDVRFRPAGNAAHPPSPVRVLLNGVLVGRWESSHPEDTEEPRWRGFDLPPQAVTAGTAELRFEIDDLFPARLDNPSDPRMLGIGLCGLKIGQQCASPPAPFVVN